MDSPKSTIVCINRKTSSFARILTTKMTYCTGIILFDPFTHRPIHFDLPKEATIVINTLNTYLEVYGTIEVQFEGYHPPTEGSIV